MPRRAISRRKGSILGKKESQGQKWPFRAGQTNLVLLKSNWVEENPGFWGFHVEPKPVWNAPVTGNRPGNGFLAHVLEDAAENCHEKNSDNRTGGTQGLRDGNESGAAARKDLRGIDTVKHIEENRPFGCLPKRSAVVKCRQGTIAE